MAFFRVVNTLDGSNAAACDVNCVKMHFLALTDEIEINIYSGVRAAHSLWDYVLATVLHDAKQRHFVTLEDPVKPVVGYVHDVLTAYLFANI